MRRRLFRHLGGALVLSIGAISFGSPDVGHMQTNDAVLWEPFAIPEHVMECVTLSGDDESSESVCEAIDTKLAFSPVWFAQTRH